MKRITLLYAIITAPPDEVLRRDIELSKAAGFNRPKKEDIYNYKEYTGEIPYIIDEFGGIRCEETQPQDNSWGYGGRLKHGRSSTQAGSTGRRYGTYPCYILETN